VTWQGLGRPRTLAIHAGSPPDPTTQAIAPVISPAVNFASRYGELGLSATATAGSAYAYSREGHPTGHVLERRLAAIEGAEDASVFATGMAAVTGVLLQFLSAGARLVVSDSSYAGTAEIVRGTLRRFDVDVVPVDTADLAAVEAALDGRTSLVFVESPSNPLTKLADIAGLAAITRRTDALLVVDSTFATPLITRPLDLGADLVIHSLSKFIGGHGDALGGAVLGRAELVDRIRRDVGIRLGAAISPFDAWLILRGVETLPLRLDAHVASAEALATLLEDHPFVTRVLYPGLVSHPQHELAARQMVNGGPMLAFSVREPSAFGAALSAIDGPITYATSLGLTRSVILWCDTAELQKTTYQLPPAQLAGYRSWAGDGVFRFSPGIEDVADLTEQIAATLEHASAATDR
jgi:cystathionine beta-lyase/cystathionine gamma-synthase